MHSKTIRVNMLSRVEGEGSLVVKIRGDQLIDVQLKIFEPPRFFEALLRGRHFTEAPDITARICGICPVAYQMSAAHAMERLAGVTVDGPLRDLRRLLYCGEWIASHALHIYLLHAPDFLGYDDSLQMAKAHPEIVQRGLALKKLGNDLMACIGGREIHPINVKVGGFYVVPTAKPLRAFRERLARAQDAALETVRWVASFAFPAFEQDYEFVALRHPEEYPMNEGRIVSSAGLDIDVDEVERHLLEEQVPHSNALQAHRPDGGAYHVGPMARYALNAQRLSPIARQAAREAGLPPVCRNPFQSIVVRSVELLEAIVEAERLIARYEPPDRPSVEVNPPAGVAAWATEAPRGLLYHRYRLDEHGHILEATIMPPTSQNQRMIEQDVRRLVATRLALPTEQLTWQCEQAIRNYDPCISCATHFLTVKVARE